MNGHTASLANWFRAQMAKKYKEPSTCRPLTQVRRLVHSQRTKDSRKERDARAYIHHLHIHVTAAKKLLGRQWIYRREGGQAFVCQTRRVLSGNIDYFRALYPTHSATTLHSLAYSLSAVSSFLSSPRRFLVSSRLLL